MESYEFTIMKVLLKQLYQKNLISTEAYSQTINKLDFELDDAYASCHNAKEKGATHHDAVSN